MTEIAQLRVSEKFANLSVTQWVGLTMEDAKFYEEKLSSVTRAQASLIENSPRGRRASKQSGCRRLLPDVEGVVAQDADGRPFVGCC